MVPEFDALLTRWTADANHIKPMLEVLYAHLKSLGAILDCKARPGVSYSLRAKHPAQKDRELFVLVDVIDDDPEARWLSICFYADLTSDPEERGDVVPGGLMGADARCFDQDEADDTAQTYLVDRLTEAFENAARV